MMCFRSGEARCCSKVSGAIVAVLFSIAKWSSTLKLPVNMGRSVHEFWAPFVAGLWHFDGSPMFTELVSHEFMNGLLAGTNPPSIGFWQNCEALKLPVNMRHPFMDFGHIPHLLGSLL